MRRKGSGPKPLADLVPPFLEKQGLTRRVDLASAVERWPTLVGPQVASVTRAEAVTGDGVLWVRVVSSAWAAELSLMAPRILARLNDRREGRVREIRWTVGPLPPSPAAAPPSEE